jgi:2-polyprenyl-6-methoxyphenol hydroxylase-like FAD-dependent oxidoreductase
MSEQIAIVGAGISGLCTALALADKGYKVTVFERDTPPPAGGAEEAFFDWNRRGAAQFRHPHAFLAVMCNLLQKNYPDLVEQFWEAGARKVTFRDMLPPPLLAGYQPEPGDDELWLLMCRRATMETLLRRYVEQKPGITINNSTNVVGIVSESTDGQIKVTGLKLQENKGAIVELDCDIVVDASGRTSSFPQWLEELGAITEAEDDDAEIVYYTRHYRLNPGEEEPPRHTKERSAGDLGYLKYGVFPGDNGNFAVIICLPNHETELREAVKSGEMFDSICRSIPGVLPWVSEDKSVATTTAFGFGDIHAIWKHFVVAGKPAALNFFAVGDSAVRTNPLYGRGCSTGIIHAHVLAEVLSSEPDLAARAITFDQCTEEELRPIFKASLQEDKRGIKRAKAILEDRAMDDTNSIGKWLRACFGDAVSAAARDQIHVMRGAMRSFNLMEKPGDFLKENRIRWTLLRYVLRGRKKNYQTRLQQGPDRKEMIALVALATREKAA